MLLERFNGETLEDYLKRLNAETPSPYHVYTVDCLGNICLLDAYVVMNAYPSSAQVQHALKKILALGKRNGGKPLRQDVEEARNQLNKELCRIDRLESQSTRVRKPPISGAAGNSVEAIEKHIPLLPSE